MVVLFAQSRWAVISDTVAVSCSLRYSMISIALSIVPTGLLTAGGIAIRTHMTNRLTSVLFE